MTSLSHRDQLAPADTLRTDDGANARVVSSYGKLPLYFIENKGQVDTAVKFYEESSGHATYFTKDGIYLSLRKTGTDSRRELLKLIPLGANKNPEIVAEGLREGKVNYLVGNDPGKWKTNVPTYQTVVYKEIYPGIDMKFYGNNQQLEYDIIVRAGADPSKVKFAYEGAERPQITESGDLEILVPKGKITQKKPLIYQDIQGKRVVLDGQFSIRREDSGTADTNRSDSQSRTRIEYGFTLARHDPDFPLVIDPILVYGTYLGGASDIDHGLGIAVDASGQAYITGFTSSNDFPTIPGSYDESLSGSGNAFVVKLNDTGSALIYATYLGGSAIEWGYGVATDGLGNAFVVGSTLSLDFPTTPGAVDTTYNGGRDAFVVKLDSTGSSLVYSTYLGGSGSELDVFGNKPFSIRVDGAGNAYVAGVTSSSDFPTTPGAFDATFNGGTFDAFVVKLDASGASTSYSTYLGGSGDDRGFGLAIDTGGNAYVTGSTTSSDFPTTPGSLDTTLTGSGDAFVIKLNDTGTALAYGTYLGGSSGEEGQGIALDGSGNAYVVGNTSSLDFPATPGAYDTTHSGDPFINASDVFVAKLSVTGSSLIYATYIGGGENDFGYAIAVDSAGLAHIAGYAVSPDFPETPGSINTSPFTAGPFVAKIDGSGSSLHYASKVGGSDNGYGYGIAIDGTGSIYVTGLTYATDLPTTVGAYDQTFNGGATDGFVLKLALGAKLNNISARTQVLTGDNVMIGGFVIQGSAPKTVLVRARGPSLVSFGVSGAMPNPYIELYSGGTKIAQNDDWPVTDPLCAAPAVSCGDGVDIQNSGKSPCSVTPSFCTSDSAIYVTLPPGPYTAIVRGVAGGTGVAIVEVIDLDGIASRKMVNISSRALVLTGDSVMIGGFVVGSEGTPKTVLLRARGPSLAAFGVSGVMADPYVELYSGSTLIAQNNNWQTTDPLCGAPAVACGDATDIQDTTKDPCSVTTTGCTLDSAIHITLPPGPYTAVVRGVGGGTGVGIVEVIDLSR